MNVVENYLAVKPNCGHQKFVERAETNSFNIPRVLVEACCHLFGIDVVKIYGSMIRHRSKSLLHQVWKLYLVNRARVALIGQDLGVLRYVLHPWILDRIEYSFSAIEVDGTSLVARRANLIVAVQTDGSQRGESILTGVPGGRWLSQVRNQAFGLKIPNLTKTII